MGRDHECTDRARPPVKVVSFVGEWPKCVKLAPVAEAFNESEIDRIIVHSAQHHDGSMPAGFFADLAIPAPGNRIWPDWPSLFPALRDRTSPVLLMAHHWLRDQALSARVSLEGGAR